MVVIERSFGFRARGFYPFNPNAVPEHLSSIYDASINNTSVRIPFCASSGNLKEKKTLSATSSNDNGIIRCNFGSSATMANSATATPFKSLHEINYVPAISFAVNKRKRSVERITGGDKNGNTIFETLPVPKSSKSNSSKSSRYRGHFWRKYEESVVK